MKTRLTFFAGRACRLAFFPLARLKPTWPGKVAAVMAVLLCAGSGFAGSLAVTITSEGLTWPFGDSGNGYTVLSGALPHWSFPAGVVCTSQPYVGTANSNCVSVRIPYFENQGSLEPLYITVTETGFGPNPTADTLTMTFSASGFSCMQTGMINGIAMGSIGPSPSTVSLPVRGPASGFSMSESVAVFSDTPYASGSFSAELFLYHNPVPEPSTLGLAGLGLAGLLAAQRTRSGRQSGREI
jgi:hypothetical protein